MKDTIQVKLKKLTNTAVTPKYATLGSACFDLVADEDIVIKPGQTIVVPTGLSFEIPEGYKMCIYPRSGVSLKTPLRIANAPAQIDSDYRGEVKVLLWNSADRNICASYPILLTIDNREIIDKESMYPPDTYVILKGDRIAQAEIIPVLQAEFTEVDTLSETQRGTGGFGSSGVK